MMALRIVFSLGTTSFSSAGLKGIGTDGGIQIIEHLILNGGANLSGDAKAGIALVHDQQATGLLYGVDDSFLIHRYQGTQVYHLYTDPLLFQMLGHLDALADLEGVCHHGDIGAFVYHGGFADWQQKVFITVVWHVKLHAVMLMCRADGFPH